MRASFLLTGAAALVIAAPSIARPAFGAAVVGHAATGDISVFASGFNNPRGLTFGPDGALYVAEGGIGGTNSTVGQCQQVPSPVGPYTGAATGSRITKVVPTGKVTVAQFPSSQTSPNQGSLISGVADMKFIGTTLYALTAGSGCSHGVPNSVNGVYRVGSSGSVSLVANLSAFQASHPVADPNLGDFEPDGTWWSMVAVSGSLYAVEPNHGELDRITTSGIISRVADISQSQGHIVPTAVAYHNGLFYVGNLGTFPIVPGSSKLLGITSNGAVFRVAGGLTTVLGLTFDSLGRLYVLETSVNSGFPEPGTGTIVRLTGARQLVVASGLALPTGMTFGPDGALYVSNLGFGPPPSLPNGPGQVLRITVPN
jgi:hypothetical protein